MRRLLRLFESIGLITHYVYLGKEKTQVESDQDIAMAISVLKNNVDLKRMYLVDQLEKELRVNK